jgi:excisionase family DNA binding protein
MKWLNIKQASEYTTLSVQTLYTYVCMQKVPFHKVGHRVLFEESELNEWIVSGGKKDERH